MKKIFVLITFLILCQSCVVKPIFYHSEAELPFYHRSTKTVFELINNQNSANTFNFGVIAAKDNDTLPYVLLTPGIEQRDVIELVDVNLFYSIPLLKPQVQEFIRILESSIDNWNSKVVNNNGLSYEFLISPQHRIVQQSEEVYAWYSILKYYFQNNEDGPLGTLLFGEGALQYIYRFEKKSELNDFAIMLKRAIKLN